MKPPVHLIANPHAGNGKAGAAIAPVAAKLRANGHELVLSETRDLDDGRRLARAASEQGAIAAALGGDGLTAAVADGVRLGGGQMLVVPCGRGNDFARKLGQAIDPLAACDLLVDGRLRSVDVALAGERSFLGICSAGLDSDVQVVANSTRLPLGRAVYVYGLLRALGDWRHARWKVTVDDLEVTFTGYSVAVGNSGIFGGGMRLMPAASLEDGMLDVVLMQGTGKSTYLLNMPKVFLGRHTDSPGLQMLRGSKISIAADRESMAFADGDPLHELPLTITVAPRSLAVWAPRL